jgi:hypothetical protein
LLIFSLNLIEILGFDELKGFGMKVRTAVHPHVGLDATLSFPLAAGVAFAYPNFLPSPLRLFSFSQSIFDAVDMHQLLFLESTLKRTHPRHLQTQLSLPRSPTTFPLNLSTSTL